MTVPLLQLNPIRSLRQFRVALVICWASLATVITASGSAYGTARSGDETKSKSMPTHAEWRTYVAQAVANKSRSRGVRRVPELPVRKPIEIRPQTNEASEEIAEKIAASEPPKLEEQDQHNVPPPILPSTGVPSIEPAGGTSVDSDVVFLPNAAKPLVGPHDVITTQAEENTPPNTQTEQTAKENVDPDNPLLEPDVQPTPPQDRGEEYCSNIANAATDARFAWQKQVLEETELELQKRITALEERIADYKKWVERRDVFVEKAKKSITDIYAKMKPDAAAQQLTALDEETAAAVLMTLNPRISSAVMAEMDANKAARLTTIISLSSKGPTPPKGPAPAAPPAERQGT